MNAESQKPSPYISVAIKASLFKFNMFNMYKKQYFQNVFSFVVNSKLLISSAQRQKGLTGYCFKYRDRPFCLQTNDLI